MIAGAALLILIFWLSAHRWKVAALGFAALGVALAAGPSTTLHRLSLLTSSDAEISDADTASVASQQQREEVFKTSLHTRSVIRCWEWDPINSPPP